MCSSDLPFVRLQAEAVDGIEELAAGEDSPRLAGQRRQQLELGGRQLDGAAAAPAERLVVGDLEMDLARHRVAVAGRPVALTPTEFELLATLAREPGRVFTRGQLLDAVHGFSLESYERAIDGHVKNLRRKVEPDPAAPRRLVTVHGVGYALAEPEPTP